MFGSPQVREKRQKREKTPSPIKVKDFFTNPLHKIKQPAFTQIGFTSATLNTFVKTFTNRQNSKYISMTAIRAYIKSFTGNKPKLMHLYQDFFNRNFVQKQNDLIELDHFMEFFVHEEKKEQTSVKNLKAIYKDLGPLDSEKLLEKSEYLGISMSEEEADKIVKMVNLHYGVPRQKNIGEKVFVQAMQNQSKQ